MVQNKIHWLILLGLLAKCPFAAFSQTSISQPTDPSNSRVLMRLTDQTALAQVGYQEEPADDRASLGSTVDDKSESATSDVDVQDESDEKEKSLADSFPVTNLRGGINDNSLQRAIAKREIVDPNVEFLSSASFAPTEYQCYAPQVWKTWESPNVRYRPLYFEDENLERYGHGVGHHLQPYKSGVHFLTRVVTLPYQIAAQGTRDCEYGLGYFRPGNCNPAYRQDFALSKRGVVAQALTVGLFLGL